MKKIKQSLVALAICFSIGVVSIDKAEASYVDTVVYTFIKTYMSSGAKPYTHDYTYKTLSYVNGYSYTETLKDVTTPGRLILGFIDEQHTRTYKIY
ncbi:hypothetical protein [Neobacillus terrae]|uniref:hypothetical protein n=1 Tax=Neobacillus terrae TaxID=3034837 RepID=UPI00140961E9|nr:hypothetical protein [Neobacillus terrae]NHM31281.1 hypothetical protein [Neobacillus terrae]